AFIGHRSCIGRGDANHVRWLRNGVVVNKIFDPAIIIIYCSCNAVAENTEIKTDVKFCICFPTQIWIVVTGGLKNTYPLLTIEVKIFLAVCVTIKRSVWIG